MLNETNGAIVETNNTRALTNINTVGNWGGLTGWCPQETIYWQSYPVYVCTDKTKKAIDILKALQAEKQIECKSVPKFIELVEKIAGLL